MEVYPEAARIPATEPRARGYLGRGHSILLRIEFAARAYMHQLPLEAPARGQPPIEAPSLEQIAFAYGVAVTSIQQIAEASAQLGIEPDELRVVSGSPRRPSWTISGRLGACFVLGEV